MTTHTCNRCQHVKAPSKVKLWWSLRVLKRLGHMVWETRKEQDGTYSACVSTRQYPNAIGHKKIKWL